MQAFHVKILMLFVFFISAAHSCEDKTNCHSFKAEISYDFVEQLTVQTTNGTAPFTYNWSHGLGTGSIAIVFGKGSYSVTVTDLSKCKAIAIYNVP
ncbi:MAG: hypothetical protein IPM92_13640 [Saprospiraceae bacterium]|nr:hypothetical protein [Saprospiraceae bacterium]